MTNKEINDWMQNVHDTVVKLGATPAEVNNWMSNVRLIYENIGGGGGITASALMNVTQDSATVTRTLDVVSDKVEFTSVGGGGANVDMSNLSDIGKMVIANSAILIGSYLTAFVLVPVAIPAGTYNLYTTIDGLTVANKYVMGPFPAGPGAGLGAYVDVSNPPTGSTLAYFILNRDLNVGDPVNLLEALTLVNGAVSDAVVKNPTNDQTIVSGALAVAEGFKAYDANTTAEYNLIRESPAVAPGDETTEVGSSLLPLRFIHSATYLNGTSAGKHPEVIVTTSFPGNEYMAFISDVITASIHFSPDSTNSNLDTVTANVSAPLPIPATTYWLVEGNLITNLITRETDVIPASGGALGGSAVITGTLPTGRYIYYVTNIPANIGNTIDLTNALTVATYNPGLQGDFATTDLDNLTDTGKALITNSSITIDDHYYAIARVTVDVVLTQNLFFYEVSPVAGSGVVRKHTLGPMPYPSGNTTGGYAEMDAAVFGYDYIISAKDVPVGTTAFGPLYMDALAIETCHTRRIEGTFTPVAGSRFDVQTASLVQNDNIVSITLILVANQPVPAEGVTRIGTISGVSWPNLAVVVNPAVINGGPLTDRCIITYSSANGAIGYETDAPIPVNTAFNVHFTYGV